MRESFPFRIDAQSHFEDFLIFGRERSLRVAFGDRLGSPVLPTGKYLITVCTGMWSSKCHNDPLQCPGMIGLDEYQFTCLWQNQNIHFASYANILALVHRIKEAQNILHDVHCVACKQTPIKGIRFKCQQCRNLSLCFECFCKGYTNAKHEIAHRMYEMSSVVSPLAATYS